jgi:hypothetical protein
MFYSTKDEFILRDGEVQSVVTGSDKHQMVKSINSLMKFLTVHQGKYLRYKNSEVNVIEEAFSRGTMMCNAIMSRRYKNILFVGHYNDHQTHWMLDKFSGRMVDVFPPERDHMQTFPDLNIVAQFVPYVFKTMEYDASFTVVRPPESKHKGVMHTIYEAVGMVQDSLPCSHQYKHGQTSWSLEGEHEKFDAVVFLGVPMVDQGVGFEEDQVREIFAPMCTEDFEMVDIYYGLPSSVKWFNGEEKDNTTMVEVAFSVRSGWDDDVKTGGGRPEEYDIMSKMISVF